MGWKKKIHLLFLTKHFGVNDKWWEPFECCGGITIFKRITWIVLIYPIVYQYRWLRFKSTFVCEKG